MNPKEKEVWFFTGSQHLYGEKTLKQVASNSEEIVRVLNGAGVLPVNLMCRETLISPEGIAQACREADSSPNCIGVICWMHTFSPARMWIQGLSLLRKPICQLHTQFKPEIPWASIDMDFMNLHQSAHGDREFGYMLSRMRKRRKVIAGHWEQEKIRQQLGSWCRAALGWDALQHLKVARIGDNMRDVAVTEGDKVEAQLRFGFSVNGYATDDVLRFMEDIPAAEVNELLEEYDSSYKLSPALKKNGPKREALAEAARIELGLRTFLREGGFGAFTDTFENLGRFRQLPGIAVQRLMAEGYGFGAEGDWKTAALLYGLKVMARGLEGGTSFMEDYTYHFGPTGSSVLGAHMLEICPSIAEDIPSCEIHPLNIGGKEDPVRLVFQAGSGPAINASLIDMGNRFRLLVNEVQVIHPPAALPLLPVARVVWEPRPNLETAASAWILGGGAHHTVFSKAVRTEHLEDLAEIAGIELLVIDENTLIREFRQSLRTNEAYYQLFPNNP